MKIQIEHFCEIGDELLPLFFKHNEEVVQNLQIKEPDIDWDTYQKMTDSGSCITVVARDDGIAGYIVNFLYYHPHYKTVKSAINDMIYVLPEYRNQGVASRLLEKTEEELKKRDVKIYNLNSINKHDFSHLMEERGFESTETTWEKILGE